MSKRSVSRDEMIDMISNTLKNLRIPRSGPQYSNFNKHIAELYLEKGDEAKAVYHLTEALGTTLRQKGCFKSHKVESKLLAGEKCGGCLDQDLLEFDGKWTGISGVLERLREMPHEWTVVQLSLEYDPRSRFPIGHRPLGLHVTRLSCGSLCDQVNNRGEGGMPVSISIPPMEGSEELPSIMVTVKEAIDKFSAKKGLYRNGEGQYDCDVQIEGVLREMNRWLGPWNCLLSGIFVDNDLQSSIKEAVDQMLEAYPETSIPAKDATNKKDGENCNGEQNSEMLVPERTKRILYLLVSTQLKLNELLTVLHILVPDETLAKYIAKGILNIRKDFEERCHSALRHPVILIVDEKLDLMPWEMISNLKQHPVSRVPCLHLLHALYRKHSNTVLKHGVNPKNGYYIINPAGDLPRAEGSVGNYISKNLPDWRGMIGRPPTSEECQNALEQSDIYVYCGHGAGNQYVGDEHVANTNVKALPMLFGCSSSKIFELGGRSEGHSKYEIYLLAGSPCVIGMLWNVLDTDTNCLTCVLLHIWLGGELDEAVLNRCPVTQVLRASKFHREKELLRAMVRARNQTRYLMNGAAFVVRGLPVHVTS